MNVFVLSTGRCGSTTFAKACEQITNYTSAHESQRRHGGRRFREKYRILRYPDNHVEVDNRLSWFLGTLEKEYGQDAFYVHLLRDREEVATSFLKRWDKRQTNIIFSFAWGILTHPYDQVASLPDDARLDIARLYWDTVNDNIRAFLRDKPRQITMWLDDIKETFADFWHKIAAEGDLSAALQTWGTAYNASMPVDELRHHKTPVTQSSHSLPLKQPVRFVPSDHQEAPVNGAAGAIGEDVAKASMAVSKALQSFQKVNLQQIRPTPQPKGWMMDEDTLAFLISVIEALNPAHVVEFGSGLSTHLIGWACARLGHPCHLTSIDHDPEFIERTRQHVLAHEPSASITYVSAPLVARKLDDRVLPTYCFSKDAVCAHGRADLIVIDGPPRALGGREGVLYQALDVARVGTLILLHDADRKSERDAIRNWRSQLDGAIEITSLPGFPKGLAAIVVVERVGSNDLACYRARRTIHELQRVVDQGTTSVLVDDGTLPAEAFAALSAKHFLERNGEYWGRPASDEQAIVELERLYSSGARFLLFVADSFWWLDHYAGFQRYIQAKFKCVLSNERLIVFDMQANGAS